MSSEIDNIINSLIKRIVGYIKKNTSFIQQYFFDINLKTDYNWLTAFIYYNSLKHEYLNKRVLIYNDKIKNINFNIYLAPIEDELKCSYNFKTNSINIIFQPIITLEDNQDLLSYNYIFEKMKKSIVHEFTHYEQSISGNLEKSKQKTNNPFDYILYFIEQNELEATANSAFYIYRQSNGGLSFLRSIGQEFIDRFDIGAKSNKIEDIINRLNEINNITSLTYSLIIKYFLLYYIPSKTNYYNLLKNDKEYKKLLTYQKENINKAFDYLKQIKFYFSDNKLIYNKFNIKLYNNIYKILENPYKELKVILDDISDFIKSNMK